MKKDTGTTRSILRKTASIFGYIVMNLVTLPYYRFFRRNTLHPILSISKNVKSQKSDAELAAMLSSWRDRKQYELYFVQVAGTLLCAAVIGCFSWEPRNYEHWLGPAARYFSLLLSLFAILLSSSQSFIFIAINHKKNRTDSQTAGVFHSSLRADTSMICDIKPMPQILPRKRQVIHKDHIEKNSESDTEKGKGILSGIKLATDDVDVSIRWNMVFVWQAPIMLLAYSVVAFLVGLTVYVCVPLYREGVPGEEVAVLYLISLGVGGFCFIWCSYWAYKFVDLEEP